MDKYEKLYNEALERFKVFKEKYYKKDTQIGDVIFDKTGKMQKDFEDIFPQLHERPLTPFQQCLNLILHEVYYASVPGSIVEDVDKFVLGIVKNYTDELVALAKRREYTDCQLRESEDERIRKWILEYLYDGLRKSDEQFKEQFKTAIAWFEKQKEQKPADIDEYKIIKKHITHDMLSSEVNKRLTECGWYVTDEKPADWSEDYREEDIQTRFTFYTYKDDPSTLYLSNVFVEEASRNHGFGTRILRAAEKVAETTGATTISLKVKQDSPANAWYRRHGYGYVAFEDGYDWLEKNLEYMKPIKQERSEEDFDAMFDEYCDQHPDGLTLEECGRFFYEKGEKACQDWSEENELMRTVIIQTLERFGGRGTTGMQIDWLKSLHPRS